MHEILAEWTSVVKELRFKDGDTVKPGDEIMILESMKMQLPVDTTYGGIIQYVVAKEQLVNQGDVLARVG